MIPCKWRNALQNAHTLCYAGRRVKLSPSEQQQQQHRTALRAICSIHPFATQVDNILLACVGVNNQQSSRDQR